MIAGKSPKNQTVHAPAPHGLSADALAGRIVRVRIDEARTWYLSGEVVGEGSWKQARRTGAFLAQRPSAREILQEALRAARQTGAHERASTESPFGRCRPRRGRSRQRRFNGSSGWN